MKFRSDYVTNSSSSSFIVSTSKEVPEKYTHCVKKITSENLNEFMKEKYELEYGDRLTYKMDDDELQKYGAFTDEQMAIMYAIKLNEFDFYLDLKEKIATGIPVYYIGTDRDWYWEQEELVNFVEGNDSEEITLD